MALSYDLATNHLVIAKSYFQIYPEFYNRLHTLAMASLQHRRTHNLLLISKLLNQRDAASPFTLVLDSLEQSGKSLLTEYMRRANVHPPPIGNHQAYTHMVV